MVLFLDLWFLGFPHVISTFTRIAFDSESFREHRFLVLGLPLIVLAGTLGMGTLWGPSALTTVYLYWQWFQYTRQSYGITRIYSRKAGASAQTDATLVKLVIYLVPLAGILHRSHERQPTFLGLEVKYLPVPGILDTAIGVAAGVAVLLLVARQIQGLRAGRLPVALHLYLLSHVAVFFVGYYLVRDLSQGWLVVNIWHNAQYLLIVWMHNNRRFSKGPDDKHRFLSRLSQPSPASLLAYSGLLFGTGTVFYLTLGYFGSLATIPLIALVAYQTVNYHHYIVDATVWRARKPKPQKALSAAA